MDTPSVPADKAATLAHYQAMAEQATAAANTQPMAKQAAAATLRELDADRRLIAAAPELLEAAGYALDVLNLNRGKQARLRAIERLQVVIAKATGSAA